MIPWFKRISGKGSVVVAASPEAVFEWLVDREKQERWMGDTIEWLPGDRSQLRAGYRGEEIMKTPGRDTVAQVELAEYDPPRLLVSRHSHEVFEATSRMELEEHGAGTRVKLKTAITYRELSTWLKVLPIGPVYSRVVRQGLEKLKQLVEADR